jgi:PAS domain S-box-containing protein
MTFTLRLRPYRTIDNVIDGVVLTFVDVTERNAADLANRNAEAFLRLLIDSTADAIYCMDRDGLVTLCNAAFLNSLGFKSEADVAVASLHDLIHHSHPDGSPYPKSDCPIRRCAKTGEPAHRDDELFFRTDGTSFPVEYWVRPILRGDELQGAVCTFVNVSERRRSEEQQGLLLRELDHRVKNLFAIVGGMVTLSARSATTPNDMAQTIHGRLGALASAHQLIRPKGLATERVKQKTTLYQLISAVLSPYNGPVETGDDARAQIQGPEISVGPEALTNLALVVHELATNAAKYGAFSVPGGRVRVSWTEVNGRLDLLWEERGGPVIAGPPEQEGFGSLLARRSVTGHFAGDLVFQWNPEGLAVLLSAAAERLAL